jgi:hypothetical protein
MPLFYRIWWVPFENSSDKYLEINNIFSLKTNNEIFHRFQISAVRYGPSNYIKAEEIGVLHQPPLIYIYKKKKIHKHSGI